MHTLLTAVGDGAAAEGLEDVEVRLQPALSVTVPDVLGADGLVLGTPANLGYMSGALKHAFDTIYYPCLDATVGRPFGLYVHGNDDVAGAIRSVEKVVTGLRWRQVVDHVAVTGPVGSAQVDACWNLAATVGASLLV